MKHFNFKDGRSPFTIFRHDLIAQRHKEEQEEEKKKKLQELNYQKETKKEDVNKLYFKASNLSDTNSWKKLPDEKKFEYSKKSVNEKKKFRIEIFLTEKILFLGCNATDKKFDEEPRQIFEVEKKLIYMKN